MSHKVDITAQWSILVFPCTIYNLPQMFNVTNRCMPIAEAILALQCQQAKRCLPLNKYLISVCAWGLLNCEPETMSHNSFGFLNYSVRMATQFFSFGSSPTTESEKCVTLNSQNRCTLTLNSHSISLHTTGDERVKSSSFRIANCNIVQLLIASHFSPSIWIDFPYKANAFLQAFTSMPCLVLPDPILLRRIISSTKWSLDHLEWDSCQSLTVVLVCSFRALLIFPFKQAFPLKQAKHCLPDEACAEESKHT